MASFQLPDDFMRNTIEELGKENADLLFASLSEEPPTSIRKHISKKPQLNFGNATTETPVEWCELGSYISPRPKFTLDPDFHAGCYYVQEASSMTLWTILKQYLPNVSNDTKILDLSAAPGGKSTLIANYLNGKGILVSNEIVKNRAYTLKYNISKEGFDNVIVTNGTPEQLGQLEEVFDVILVDAPCSGEGMFRKDPASIAHWSQNNVMMCAQRQKDIVTSIIPSLKEGGLLIYSTCTYNPHENINNIHWLESIGLQSKKINLPDTWNIQTIEYNQALGYQCYPHKVKGEGFYFSVLQNTIAKNNSSKIRAKDEFIQPNKGQLEELSKWTKPKENVNIFLDKVFNAHKIPQEGYLLLLQLFQITKVIYAGITIGTFNKNILQPDHSLAFYNSLSDEVETVELSHHESLLFLKKELHAIDSAKNSWHLATYRNNGIGWCKNLGNRINNYLPNEYKIQISLQP